jgi:glutamate synthase domain-containing protein 2
MGGIKSLDRGAPSIKMASEPEDEFELELMSVIREFNDKMQNGELDPSVTIDQYINDYLSRKKMMMQDKNRQMAMYGGRMQYADGTPDKMGNPAVMTKIENMREERIMNPDVEDVADYKTYYKKLKAQDEEIKRMLEKVKKEKKKLAMGGIAGVL